MKTAFKMFCLLLLLLSFVHQVEAQNLYSLTGKVQDDNGPLVGANVVLKDIGSDQHRTGISTDANGCYSLQVPKGKYNLEITYVGYSKYVTNVEVKNSMVLPDITLYEDVQMMDAVVVTARTVTYNAGGYVADISKNPFYRERDMSSILKLTPGTHATAKGLRVYGKEVSKVYMNGRELKLSGEELINYLATLEGKNVKQMEVVAASGAEEDATTMGSSIIKITTINPETGGMLNFGDMSILHGDQGRYSHAPNVVLNWRLGKKWATYFNGNALFNESPTGNDTETHFYDTGVRLSNEQKGKIQVKGNYRALWGISYDLDANNLFSLEAFYANRKNHTSLQEITRQMVSDTYQTISEGNTDTNNKFWETNLSFMYKHLFGKSGELIFQADRLEKHTTGTDINRYVYSVGDDTERRLLSDEKHLFYTARVDYVQRFNAGGGTLKIGVKYTNLSDEQDTDYAYFLNGQKDDATSYLDLYKYSEEIYAAYAKYSFKVKNFDFNIGLRMEHSLLSPHSSSNPERNEDNKETHWAPEAGVSYMLNKEKGHNLSLQYNRSVSRPHFSYLNPLMKRVNEYSYSMGNPLLGAGVSDNFSLRTTLFNEYAVALGYYHTGNEIIMLPENINGILHSSPRRGGKSDNYYVDADIPVKLGRWGQVKFNAGYSFSKSSYKDDHNKSGRWTYGFFSMFQLPAGFNMDVSCSGATPVKSVYGETRSHALADVRISKSFLNRSLNVTLIFSDLFNTFGSFEQKYNYKDHSYVSKPNYHSFYTGISVRYTLRWGQKSMVRRGGSGNSEESSRISTN